MKDEALRLALEALDTMKSYGNVFLHKRNEQNPFDQVCEAITAIKAALEQPEPEPVAITITGKLGNTYSFISDYNLKKGDKVYTTPPKREPEPVECMCGICKLGKREWQGLTDEEINLIYAEPQTHIGQYARAIETKLKEKNCDPR